MRIRTTAIAALIAAGMSCSAAAQSLEGLPSYRPAVDEAVKFPDPARATRKAGAFVAPRNLAMVTPGMTKQQIYTLLGVPHFHEALFGERRWDYILNFYSGTGAEFVSCQFQIRFDRHRKVEQTYFKDRSCAERLGRLLEAPTSR